MLWICYYVSSPHFIVWVQVLNTFGWIINLLLIACLYSSLPKCFLHCCWIIFLLPLITNQCTHISTSHSTSARWHSCRYGGHVSFMNEETEAKGEDVIGKSEVFGLPNLSASKTPFGYCPVTFRSFPSLNPFYSWCRFDRWCVHYVSKRGQTQSGALAESACTFFPAHFLPLLSLANFRQTSSPLVPVLHKLQGFPASSKGLFMLLSSIPFSLSSYSQDIFQSLL